MITASNVKIPYRIGLFPSGTTVYELEGYKELVLWTNQISKQVIMCITNNRTLNRVVYYRVEEYKDKSYRKWHCLSKSQFVEIYRSL